MTMTFLNKYRDPQLARKIIDRIKETSTKPVKFMEVCGTHTVAIFRHGIRDVLPEHIALISGPGCPVCVTPNKHIDEAIELGRRSEVILTSFGDMMKVPGSWSSLAAEKARGSDIRIVSSTKDVLELAKANPEKEVIFFGIGFETTSPTIAAAILQARRDGIHNFSIVGAQKLVSKAIRALLTHDEIGISGFICPGHVSTLIGVRPYAFIARDFGLPAVIIGFEPVDILQGIYMLVKQIEEGRSEIEVQYSRGVPLKGNPHAMSVLYSVFKTTDALWRGIGIIPGTGLALKEEFQEFDAVKKFGISVAKNREHPDCKCGQILRGIKKPWDCELFGKACLPEHPIGPCMVSVEGTCAAYFKYGRGRL